MKYGTWFEEHPEDANGAEVNLTRIAEIVEWEGEGVPAKFKDENFLGYVEYLRYKQELEGAHTNAVLEKKMHLISGLVQDTVIERLALEPESVSTKDLLSNLETTTRFALRLSDDPSGESPQNKLVAEAANYLAKIGDPARRAEVAAHIKALMPLPPETKLIDEQPDES